MVLMWNALKTIYFFNCEAINLAKPVPIRCNLQRPNVIVANPSQVVPHQDTKRRLQRKEQLQSPWQKRSQLQIVLKREKATAKAKAKAKAMAAAGKNSKVGKKKKERRKQKRRQNLQLSKWRERMCTPGLTTKPTKCVPKLWAKMSLPQSPGKRPTQQWKTGWIPARIVKASTCWHRETIRDWWKNQKKGPEVLSLPPRKEAYHFLIAGYFKNFYGVFSVVSLKLQSATWHVERCC